MPKLCVRAALLAILACAVVTTGAMPVRAQTLQQQLDEAVDWAKIESSKKTSDFEKYLKKYPKGKHVADAQKKLDALNAAAANPPPPQPSATQQAEDAVQDEFAWSQIEKSKKASDFQAYLTKYPKGRHVADAQKKLTALSQ
jgi:outer membrane protein assembly factor BamD (BamD/ComL family)